MPLSLFVTLGERCVVAHCCHRGPDCQCIRNCVEYSGLATAFTVSRPYDGSLGHAFNMHHDTNKSPRRVATVIIYLLTKTRTDCSEARPSFHASPSIALPHCIDSQRSVCATAGWLYESHRFLECHGHVWQPSIRREATRRRANCARGDSLAAREPSVRIIPRRGTALLFFSGSVHSHHRHVHADSWGDMWHGGCRVRQGEKWTLQLFKEMAIGDDGISRQADATAM